MAKIITSSVKYTGGAKIVIKYDDYIESFVMSDNTYITTKVLNRIGNTPILSQSESMLTRLNVHFKNA